MTKKKKKGWNCLCGADVSLPLATPATARIRTAPPRCIAISSQRREKETSLLFHLQNFNMINNNTAGEVFVRVHVPCKIP